LKPEHLSVFDCAFKPRLGTRSLHYRGHIRMMAAAQPFLSGAISKTVNLPETATVEDIVNTYIEGWKLGLKAIAIYRDGSKRSAPLNVKKTKDMGGSAADEVEAEISSKGELEARIVDLEKELGLLRAQALQPVRNRMPETRMSLTHKFEIAGHEGYFTVGLFENQQPGELFIQMAKEGSTIGGLMDTVATLTSMALQYGVPLESLVKKFAYQRFEPSGFTKNPDIRNATSITDYVFRWLGCHFIKGYKEATSPNSHQPDLPIKGIVEMEKKALNRPVSNLQRTGEKEVIDIITNRGNSEGILYGNGHGNGSGNGHEKENGHAQGAVHAETHAERLGVALSNVFMDVPCSNCGSSKVIRAGACGCCTDCGTSQGCS
jgi:ribonucleoside-diphosphate reductase alpha chain